MSGRQADRRTATLFRGDDYTYLDQLRVDTLESEHRAVSRCFRFVCARVRVAAGADLTASGWRSGIEHGGGDRERTYR